MAALAATLRSGRVLVMDGAMGTELMRRTGASIPFCGEGYNLSAADLVQSIHRAYLDAGADVLLTNTFQANRVALARAGLLDRRHDIWHAALELARLDDARSHFVLADVGPFENPTDADAEAILAECCGADGLLLETWSSLETIRPFAQSEIPLLVSFTFQRTHDLMTFEGHLPEACARAADSFGAIAIGANCGKDIDADDLIEIVKRYRRTVDLPVFVKPNAGSPGHLRTPEMLAEKVVELLKAGVAMIGGCCGTTPAHIKLIRGLVDAWNFTL
jgi:5-methyltetrahydrofolate--homocysteine methyltransferase